MKNIPNHACNNFLDFYIFKSLDALYIYPIKSFNKILKIYLKFKGFLLQLVKTNYAIIGKRRIK